MKEMNIPSEKVEKKFGVLKSDHMSQHRGQHMAPHHSKNKNMPLICHHCGIYGHIRSYFFNGLS